MVAPNRFMRPISGTSSSGVRPSRWHSSMIGLTLSSTNSRTVSRAMRSSSDRSGSISRKSTPGKRLKRVLLHERRNSNDRGKGAPRVASVRNGIGRPPRGARPRRDDSTREVRPGPRRPPADGDLPDEFEFSGVDNEFRRPKFEFPPAENEFQGSEFEFAAMEIEFHARGIEFGPRRTNPASGDSNSARRNSLRGRRNSNSRRRRGPEPRASGLGPDARGIATP